jgi:hypothetical protein
MSKTRTALVAVVSIVAVVAMAAVIDRGNRHHPPARPAAVIRSVAPAAATPPIPSTADFAADTFLNLLTGVDPTMANQLIDALSSGDRAVLQNDLETRTGLSAG